MLGGWVRSGAAGGRPRHMRAWARRYRQAYRVLPAAPHAPGGARPTQRSRASHVTAARSGPHAAALAACHAHGRTTLGLRDRPTPASAAPLAASVDRGARWDAASRATQRPGCRPRQRCLLRALLGGWVGSGAAGGRPRPMRAWARRYRQAYRVLPAAPHATDGARPTQRWRSAPRYGGAIRPPRRGPGGTPRAWPDHARAEGPPNTSFSSTAGSRDRPRRATARDRIVQNAQVEGRASGVCCERGWAAAWAAGRRAGAHRTYGRYARRVWQAYRVLPAARRNRRRPPAAACKKRPTLPRRDPAHAAALAALHAHARERTG